MAGKPKTGLDYAGWSVNLFDGDTKFDGPTIDGQVSRWRDSNLHFTVATMRR